MKNLDFDCSTDGDRIIFVPPMWDDLKYPAQGINPPGAASDPTRDTNDGMLLFSPTQANIIAGGALIPHGAVLGGQLEPHIHWCPTTTGAGNIVWRFEYSFAANGDVFPAYTTIDITVPAGGVAERHTLTSFGLITPPKAALAMMLKWKISRLGSDGADTYGADARLLEFDIHCQFDGIGSQEQYTKAD